MSLYDCLGVDPTASTEDINAAYRKAAKAHYPDAGGDPEAFARCGHAVAILRDPERRAEYDRSGKEDFHEDHPDGRAIASVSQAFGAALQAFAEGQMPSTQDLMAVVRRNLSESLRNQRSELQKASAAQLRNRDARERLTHKGAGPDILGRMLADQADNIAKSLPREASRPTLPAPSRWQRTGIGGPMKCQRTRPKYGSRPDRPSIPALQPKLRRPK